MYKQNLVNNFIKSVHLNHDWAVKNDRQAEELVESVIEGDFNVISEWDEAFARFCKVFVSFCEYQYEQARY